MKKRLGIILVVAASTLLMPSCKKKSDDPQPEESTETPVTPPATIGTFTAKVNGTAKTFGLNFYITNSGITGISASDAASGTGISLGLFGSTVGSYDIDGTLTQATYVVGSTQSSATSGKITITKVENNKMSGTFNFEVAGGVKVTEGVFTDVPKK